MCSICNCDPCSLIKLPSGKNGKDGSQIYHGSGAPDPGLGLPADYYIDQDADPSAIYSKSTGTWTIIVTLTNGANGTNALILSGTADAPDNTPDPGVAAAMYIQTGTGSTGANGDVWVWDGTWTNTINILGKNSSAVTVGAQGNMPAVGSNIFMLCDYVGWCALGQPVYLAGIGQFEVVGNVGPPYTTVNLQNIGGPNNIAPGDPIGADLRLSPGGFNGVDGSSIEADSGAVDPTTPPTTGNTGFYINTVTFHFWQYPLGGPWTDLGSFQGATGTGAPGHTPVVFSGSGAPAGGTGVVGDLYFRQTNPGNLTVYSKTGVATWTQQAQVLSSRTYDFGAIDPNTINNTPYNDGDFGYGNWTGPEVISTRIAGVWTIFYTFPSGGGGGVTWPFYATKTTQQPLVAASGNVIVNFETATPPPPNQNPGGNWVLFQYTVPADTTPATRTFSLYNFFVGRPVTGSAYSFTVQIMLNGAPGTGTDISTAPAAFTLTSGGATDTLSGVAILQSTPQVFLANDVISVYLIKPATTATLFIPVNAAFTVS